MHKRPPANHTEGLITEAIMFFKKFPYLKMRNMIQVLNKAAVAVAKIIAREHPRRRSRRHPVMKHQPSPSPDQAVSTRSLQKARRMAQRKRLLNGPYACFRCRRPRTICFCSRSCWQSSDANSARNEVYCNLARTYYELMLK